MREELRIIFDLWELDREWNRLCDPQFTFWGNMSFRRLNDHELFRVVAIQDQQKKLKKELRQKIGWVKYIQFLFAPLRVAKSLRK